MRYLLFALLALSLSVYSAASAAFYVSDELWLTAAQVANGGRIASLSFLVHLVLAYADVDWRRPAMIGVYATGGALAIANAAGLFFDVTHKEPRLVRAFGADLRAVPTLATPAAAAFAVASVAAVLLCTALLARTVIRGRREGLGTFLGLAVLTVVVVHDAGRAVGWLGGLELGPYGYVAFVAGGIGSLLAQYATLRRQLEARALELRERSRELGNAFEELRAAQPELVRKEQLAAVGELSAVVAHEVRNPLSIIANAVSTLRRDTVGAEDRATLLGILDEEAGRLNRIVGDLLHLRAAGAAREARGLRPRADRARPGARRDLPRGDHRARGERRRRQRLGRPRALAAGAGEPDHQRRPGHARRRAPRRRRRAGRAGRRARRRAAHRGHRRGDGTPPCASARSTRSSRPGPAGPA